ncbi:hypothetical protein HanRHA438_Chr17g0822371 [Helianthus annuus]|nr:hypothetical protein HanRHA438_Chr17g0822371 [Helianthus annuus]
MYIPGRKLSVGKLKLDQTQELDSSSTRIRFPESNSFRVLDPDADAGRRVVKYLLL